MPVEHNLALTSLALSVAIGGIAVLLGLHQWSQWRDRDARLVKVDRTYFFRQDWRRALGVLLMLMIAVGIYVGSRTTPVITRFPVDPDVRQARRIIVGSWVATAMDEHANPRFLAIWLGVIVLLVTLLGLAFFDWIATRRYVRRQRQSVARDRLELLRETFRKVDTDRNGHAT